MGCEEHVSQYQHLSRLIRKTLNYIFHPQIHKLKAVKSFK